MAKKKPAPKPRVTVAQVAAKVDKVADAVRDIGQKIADVATSAINAQTSADAAQAAAEAAQSTADAAQTAADTAQSTADAAQATAEEAKKGLEDLREEVSKSGGWGTAALGAAVIIVIIAVLIALGWAVFGGRTDAPATPTAAAAPSTPSPEGEVNKLIERTEALEEGQAALGGRMDAAKDRANEHELMIGRNADRITREAEDRRELTDELKRGQEDLVDHIEELDGRIIELQGRMKAVEKGVRGLRKEFNGFKADSFESAKILVQRLNEVQAAVGHLEEAQASPSDEEGVLDALRRIEEGLKELKTIRSSTPPHPPASCSYGGHYFPQQKKWVLVR